MSAQEAAELFPTVHARLVGRRPAMVARDAVAWKYALSAEDPHIPREEAHLFLAVHEGDAGVDGYLVYRIRGDWSPRGPEATIVISEMVADDPAVTAELWRYCTEMDLVRRIEASGRGCRPVDDPIWWLLADPQAMVATLTTTLWARVLDVPKFLEGRHYQQDGSIIIDLEDGAAGPGGRFRLEVSGGLARCTETSGSGDISLGWSELGSVSLGLRCISHLLAAGRVRVTSEDVARRADAILSWEPAPWCFEDI
ncbi:MAG: sterol carrier protein domain-containing protein [Candidatus Dormibacteria bacterium]